MRKYYYLQMLTALSCCLLFSTSAMAREVRGDSEKEPACTREVVMSDEIIDREDQDNDARDQANAVDSNQIQRIEVSSSSESEESSLKAKSTIIGEVYSTTHVGVYHVPVAVSAFGDVVETEDGACYSVDPDDRYKVFRWFATDALIITQNTAWFSAYDYTIINTANGDHVNVNLLVKPFYNGYYTYYIVAVDAIDHAIYLNDGSIWKIKSFDSINNWWINDTVIIGINAYQGLYSNILINASTGKYIRANCLN